MKGLYQQRTVTRVQRDRSYSQRSGSMFARVCLRGGSGITTYTGVLFHLWLRQFTKGGTWCYEASLQTSCAEHSPSARSVPLSSRDDALSRAMDQEILPPFERKIIAESLDSFSSSISEFNEFVERIDWTWIDQSCVFCVDWHSANIRISNKNFARFLFSRTFQKARCRVSKQDWFIRTISVQSTFNV